MSSVFLGSGDGGLTPEQLQDGSFALNVARVTCQALVPGLPVACGSNKQLISRLIGPADLSGVSFITNPLNATLSCLDVLTAYNTVPRSLNGLVTAFDAFEGRSLGNVGNVQIYKGKVGTGTPSPYLSFNSLTAGFGTSIVDSGGDDGIVISSTIVANNLSVLGQPIYAGQTAPDGALEFNTLSAGSGGISVATAAGTVTVNNTLTAANVGGGAGVFVSKIGSTISLKSIKAGPGLVVTSDVDEIFVGADQNITGVAAVNSVAPAGACESWIGSTPAGQGGAARLVNMYPTVARWIVAGIFTGLRYSNDAMVTKIPATTTSGTLSGLYVAAYNGATAIAREYFNASLLNEVWSSSDGTVWTPIAAGQRSCWDIVWTGNQWVAAVEEAGIGIQRSVDGSAWTPVTTPRDPTWVIALGGTRLAAGGAAGQIYSVNGGLSWANSGGLDGPTASIRPAWDSVNDVLIATTSAGNRNLIRSYDGGATWFAQTNSNSTNLNLSCAFWSSVHNRFYFAGTNLVDGLMQFLTTVGGNPNLVIPTSSYALAPITGLNAAVGPITMGYDQVFQRFVISGNIGQTYYSSGSNAIATLGSDGSGGLTQSYGGYIQGRTTQPVDQGQRATLYLDSTTQNLVLRWNGIGYNLAGGSASVDIRFDGTLAQVFYANTLDGQLAFGWSGANRQLTFTPVGTTIGGSTSVICTYCRVNGTGQPVVSTVLSAALVAGSVYFLANASTTPAAAFNLNQASGPMRCEMSLAPGTGTAATTAWYDITVNIATAGPGNISIRKLSRR